PGDEDAAGGFVAAGARVLERRMFQRLFQDGPAGPVRDAIAAYRNADGGFGHGIEPDCRTPASQPAAVEMALRLMDAADEWDERLVRGACDWLLTVAPAGGGVSFAEATVSQGPDAAWWAAGAGHRAAVLRAGQLAGGPVGAG